MILLLNGAFGIGKTAVARSLARQLPGSMVFNPEPIGVAMLRAARLAGSRVDDFQDFPLWRRLTVAGLRGVRAFRPNIIVPMAFSNAAYLAEVRANLHRVEDVVLHICLVAPLETVHARLRSRGAHPVSQSWEYQRAAECCAVHPGADFSEHVSASGSLEEVVAEVMAVMTRAARRANSA